VTETRPTISQRSNEIWHFNNISQFYAAPPDELLIYSTQQSPS